MSMLRHRDEFLDLYKNSGDEFVPEKPCQETDILGGVYTLKPDELPRESRE